MNKTQLYAKFYDLEYVNKKDDVDFYYKLAQKVDGPILECGCGTGRILAPIARSGKAIWGFDINTAMLDITKKRIKTLKIKKVKIFEDDLTNFSSPLLKNKQFDFIFLSFDSLAYLAQKDGTFYSPQETQHRQYLALKNIAKRLDANGIFAFDLFAPNDLSKEYTIRHHFSRIIKNETWSLFSAIQIPTKHIFQIHYFMEVSKNNGVVQKWHYPVSAYQATFPEIKSLLGKVGLHPVKIYGDFSLKPYKPSSEQMIFICRKK
ncbi:class I SAM-dependent methyltransferase [Candidatus Wolfebacteria bacterium]|nr:class I SAM-dependent methyltransferase [Candidatus Wolfebacteria bacterium]